MPQIDKGAIGKTDPDFSDNRGIWFCMSDDPSGIISRLIMVYPPPCPDKDLSCDRTTVKQHTQFQRNTAQVFLRELRQMFEGAR